MWGLLAEHRRTPLQMREKEYDALNRELEKPEKVRMYARSMGCNKLDKARAAIYRRKRFRRFCEGVAFKILAETKASSESEKICKATFIYKRRKEKETKETINEINPCVTCNGVYNEPHTNNN